MSVSILCPVTFELGVGKGSSKYIHKLLGLQSLYSTGHVAFMVGGPQVLVWHV